MEQYGKILLFAMPAFLALVLLEKWWGWYKGKDTVPNMDMIASLSSGVTNVTKDVLGIGIAVLGYDWLVNRIALTHIQSTWFAVLIAFFVLDFAGYWVHRIDHKINFFWNSHIIHHSSEEFNLACALRQSISTFLKLFAFLLIPAALMGVPSIIIATVAPIHLFAQFWYHTQHINRMGFVEKILVTPSHHRVHHAINKEYIDKNYSQIFIFWDKLFGTFQEELPDVKPVYGITRPAQTWNPIRINFQHLRLLIQDAWHAQSVKDKLRIWFMPTGWRPADVAAKYPVNKIEDVYSFEKYATKTNPPFTLLIWIQLVVSLLLITYLFGNIAAIGSPGMFVYGAFVFVYVYAYSELMDGNKYALVWELIKASVGLAIIFYSGDWFGANKFLSWISNFLIIYFIASAAVTGWFVYSTGKAERPLTVSV